MDHAIIFDCEFLTAEGAPRRFWCGPYDPDPTVVQIGAVRLGLGAEFPVLDRFEAIIRPVDRYGAPMTPYPAFTSLTGLTPARIAVAGGTLASALTEFAEFVRKDQAWSWGKDELDLMAISPWIVGIPAPMPAHRFGNACSLLLKAAVPSAEIEALRSQTLCAHFGLTPPDGSAHDACHDAMSLATVLRHLLGGGRLVPADLQTAP